MGRVFTIYFILFIVTKTHFLYLKDADLESLTTPFNKTTIEVELTKRRVKKTANGFACQKNQCPGWGIIEDDNKFFQCPLCNTFNCIQCKVCTYKYLEKISCSSLF